MWTPGERGRYDADDVSLRLSMPDQQVAPAGYPVPRKGDLPTRIHAIKMSWRASTAEAAHEFVRNYDETQRSERVEQNRRNLRRRMARRSGEDWFD